MCRLTAHATASHSKFMVTITETLKRTVEVEAGNQYEAEQTVSDGWHNSKYILGSEDFSDVNFEAEPMIDEP